MGISSAVVLCEPEDIGIVIDELKGIRGVEMQLFDESQGKIIVTIEGEDVETEMDILKKIQVTNKIKMAEMVFHTMECENNECEEVVCGGIYES